MISFIVAMDKHRLIGKENDLPWRLPADLAHFKRVTSGHTVIMGRKTYESIGKPLPNRRNVVVTRSQAYTAEGVDIVHSIDEAIRLTEHENETFVIGGSELFKAFWPHADRMYVTYIDEVFDGDTYFPEIDGQEWELVSVEAGTVDEKNVYPHEFRVYERQAKN
ncbi:dihydrofolate reductase [Halalkalibacterium halodurans]|uniref:Dihydrofolate reductase n=1 Tax=Halalkalibacterium halodurans TaxID=86665 RepID=A0A0M0KHE1_ALKHA|nr:dihydrofolate reductase [Halalkalibacterium halodurans]MDY7223976.1 dihydrofolate reductase [Halalkalibacterium halodurans]MDY7243197.1 dihydrofolate reductase [Halalkalibacterium halodurans]MED3645298.1 dihydrofolate reductase [Halalkalibacterium halodurans]MED4163658.1 dihydrofolate reductase [Halalkalibacterium halodurans]TES54323.1 dihydrofolate reductase [Halalkalibacterium halodurans]